MKEREREGWEEERERVCLCGGRGSEDIHRRKM
jgi:hypothetical protein